MNDVFGMHLQGGLGNMMFQIATAEWLAFKFDKQVCYPNVNEQFDHLKKTYVWTRHADEYKTIFKNFDFYKNQDLCQYVTNHKEIGFRYEQIEPEDGVCYNGYFQSDYNFDTDYARWLFEFSHHDWRYIRFADRILFNCTCSIHVRRGNYLLKPESHITQSLDYYLRAIKYIERTTDVDYFVVFSDDIEWCKQHFVGDSFLFINETDYIEMWMMSRCDHNIISNSSFSWWGAMLGDQKGRKVIAPAQWFPNNNPDSSDMIPYYWTIL